MLLQILTYDNNILFERIDFIIKNEICYIVTGNLFFQIT